MKVFSLVTTDKKIAGKTAWVMFTLCTFMAGVLAFFSEWPLWAGVILGIQVLILTLLSFHPKSSPKIQSVFAMLFFFSTAFLTSILEQDIYPSIFVFLGAAVILAVYLNELLIFAYFLLIALGMLYHLLFLNTIPLDTSVHITEFVVRLSILFIALFFLMVFIRKMNRNRERMERSVAEAKRAEQYQSDFLANMSHEIRTPMNAIIGMCELILREDNLSERVRENGFNIQASGRSLLSIINDILDYSKIDSGRMELIKEEFNIASILNDVINMSEARRGSKNIKLLANIAPDIPRGLIGDEIRIRQIIINLMTNAIKFTEKGTVTLTVTYSVQDYGINLVVSVADTGIGITEENIEKIFTSFRQVDTRKNRAVEGTGLGLPISKNLISQMGGFINAKSEYGKGSEFRFVIPLQVSDSNPFAAVKAPNEVHAIACFEESEYAMEEGTLFVEMGRKLGVDFKYVDSIEQLKDYHATHGFTHLFINNDEYLKSKLLFEDIVKDAQIFVVQDRAETVPLYRGIQRIYSPLYVISVVSAINQENMVLNLNDRGNNTSIHFTAPKANVLIVDDNIINLKVAIGLMQPYHMHILTATSGPEAIKMLETEDIDLVFMDHMMPGMDGVEATTIIRNKESEYYKTLPIIALTANVANGARETFLGSGFDDFLAKPIELSALDKVLRNHLPEEYIEAPTKATPEKKTEEAYHVNQGNSLVLDIAKGIAYMGGSEESYKEILSLYVQSSREKIKLIDELFQQKNIKDYIIEVHALKSTSLSIGAVKLSELAKELEADGKEGSINEDDAERNDELLKLYEDVVAEAQEYLGETVLQDAEDSNEELTEISIDALKEYLDRAMTACSGFDADKMAEIAAEMASFVWNGESVKRYFEKAAQLAESFEYEAAEDELKNLAIKLDDE